MQTFQGIDAVLNIGLMPIITKIRKGDIQTTRSKSTASKDPAFDWLKNPE